MIGVFYEEIDGKNRITQVTDRPQVFIGGDNFLLLNEMPIPEYKDGYYEIPYVNLEENKIYYEYFKLNTEPSPPNAEERINALEEALLLMMMEG